jgi:mono/diheme cytochrome c family protein
MHHDMRPRRTAPWPLLSVGLIAACASGSSGANSVAPEALTEATTLYQARCAKCHGTRGRGDGPESAKLNPKPRNFTDFTWQLAVSDRHLEKAIREGGPAVGKSALMQPNADLADRPEIVAALRLYLRTLVAPE